MADDFFRPRHEPARTIYDAFQAEAAKRHGRTVPQWLQAEREAVWSRARDAAQQMGLRVPTMDDVERAERQASGHCDYGAKWAYGVVECMRKGAANG
jgi:hypothetical protein